MLSGRWIRSLGVSRGTAHDGNEVAEAAASASLEQEEEVVLVSPSPEAAGQMSSLEPPPQVAPYAPLSIVTGEGESSAGARTQEKGGKGPQFKWTWEKAELLCHLREYAARL
jgi:hypothetical protein